MLVEPVAGRVFLKDLDGAKSMQVTPLDLAGRPMAESDAATQHNGTWFFRIGDPAALWHHVQVSR
jgi:hypothetical protein